MNSSLAISRLVRGPRLALGGALFFASLGAVLLLGTREAAAPLKMSAGDALGRRHEIAVALAAECTRLGVPMEVVATRGSEDALAKVEAGTLDIALVQGGLEAGNHVREIAPLDLEPLHLLVKDASMTDVASLRGRRVHIGTRAGGTQRLSRLVLSLAHLTAGRDFEAVVLTHEELEQWPRERLPDAVFTLSSLPSPVVSNLIDRRGFSIVPLPYAAALALRDVIVQEGRIPAFAYGSAPGNPAVDVPTVAKRMVVVAGDRVPEAAAKVVAAAAFGDRFARDAHLPHRSEDVLQRTPEFAYHAGAIAFMHRNDPVLTPEWIEGIENSRSFLVAFGVAVWLFVRWYRSRRWRSFENYLDEVTAIEKEAMRLEAEGGAARAEWIGLRGRLARIKGDALEQFTRGAVRSGELLSAFLAHVGDARRYLDKLIRSAPEDRKDGAAGGD